MDIMAFDRALVTDEAGASYAIAQRFERAPQERFERIFPPPHQRWLDAQSFVDRGFAVNCQ